MVTIPSASDLQTIVQNLQNIVIQIGEIVRAIDQANGFVLYAPNGSAYQITVDNSGRLQSTPVTLSG